MRLLMLSLLTLSLFASTILNINIKKTPSKVELSLNFDIPFDGKIKQKITSDKIILFIEDAKILTPWLKKLNSPFLYQLEITPTQNGSNVIIYPAKKVKVYAARSNDGFSLKIIIKNLAAVQKHIQKKEQINFNFTYLLYGVLALIVIITLIAFLKKLNKATSKVQKTKTIHVENPKLKEFSIKFEKPLDEKNKIALISFRGTDYLVLIGNSNVLLGKYNKDDINSYEEFEEVISSQNLHQASQQKPEDEIFTTIEEYKRKVSKEL